MAIETYQVEVCDVCRSRDDLTNYTITRTTGRPKRVALCPTHGAPVEEVLAAATARKAPARSNGRKVATLSDVEAAKPRALGSKRG